MKVCRAGFPSSRLPPAPLGSGHPNPFLEPPVGVPIKCPALPRYPPKHPTPFRAFRAPDPRLTNPRRPHPPFRTRLPEPRFPPVLPSRLVVRS